jgi:hypothetical protein
MQRNPAGTTWVSSNPAPERERTKLVLGALATRVVLEHLKIY